MEKQNTRAPIWTKNFISITLTQFIVFVAFYTLLTTLPLYVIKNLGRSEADGGLIVTVMLISAIIIRPLSALFLEKAGKKRGLLISVLAFTATTFLYIWIESFIPLLAVRFLHGLSFGIVTTATGAIAADVVPDNRRGEGLGYFAMANNLAVVVGPFIGLLLIQYVSFQTLFLLLSLIVLSGAVFSFIIDIPDNRRAASQVTKRKLSIHDLFEIKALPIALISTLVAISYSSILSYLSVYADAIGLAKASSYFFLVFAFLMLLSRPYLGRSFDLKGPNFVILPGLFIFAIGLVLLGFTTSAWMLLLAAGFIGLGYGSLLPSFQTMAIQSAHPARSGHSTATFFTFYDIGVALGSVIWGAIAGIYSFTILYILSAGVAIVVVIVFTLYQRRHKKVTADQ
ncbi:MFS transporter [Oceanobacillus massiliensis]|uniref:MFS transporter n=1 Tax=Oceanobacillus massiliensis TaxID=1465765 RepID=UPI0002895CF4|nr:MFS transporter [Oceanobacillus massiliensis]